MEGMHLIYGLGECNAAEARRLYGDSNRFSNRRLPDRKTFQRLDEHLRDTNSFKKRMLDAGKPVSVRTVNLEESLRKYWKKEARQART